jgi:hypothetical protein
MGRQSSEPGMVSAPVPEKVRVAPIDLLDDEPPHIDGEDQLRVALDLAQVFDNVVDVEGQGLDLAEHGRSLSQIRAGHAKRVTPRNHAHRNFRVSPELAGSVQSLVDFGHFTSKPKVSHRWDTSEDAQARSTRFATYGGAVRIVSDAKNAPSLKLYLEAGGLPLPQEVDLRIKELQDKIRLGNADSPEATLPIKRSLTDFDRLRGLWR